MQKAGNNPRRLSAPESKVLAVFRDHPNRALAPDEVVTIIGKPKFDMAAVFRMLKREFLIYPVPDETLHERLPGRFETRYRLEA